MGIKCLQSVLVVTSLILSTSASAAVITFNGTAADGASTLANGIYTEGGYELDINNVSGGYSYFMDNSAFPGLNSFDDDVLAFNGHLASFTMVRADGGLFDLFSIDTGTLGRDSNDNGDFIFTGFFDGGSISSTITATSTVTTNTFSGFVGLTSILVTANDGRYPVLDNITVAESISSVPVPAAVWLFGSGLIGLVGLARKT